MLLLCTNKTWSCASYEKLEPKWIRIIQLYYIYICYIYKLTLYILYLYVCIYLFFFQSLMHAKAL